MARLPAIAVADRWAAAEGARAAFGIKRTLSREEFWRPTPSRPAAAEPQSTPQRRP
jgi:hypothetical protein